LPAVSLTEKVLPFARREAALDERIRIDDARRECKAALDRLEARCRAEGIAEAVVIDLRVVAEEVLTNVAKYAFEPGVTPALELGVSFTGVAVRLVFRDEGRAFDPLGEPPPALDLPPEERATGGLGLMLVRALVDEARYERAEGANVLRLVKRRAPQ
jgi:anti-sigma regulatory factor (Ser/Thr protein kinase)